MQRGSAYSQAGSVPQLSTLDAQLSWPTYRHDAARSGFTKAPLSAELRRRWQVDLGGRLTSTTAADGKVFVALVDQHRLSAIDADSGRLAWQVTAGARIDSPPTLHQGRAIFGCRDGFVYSVETSGGELAWRLRAARADRRIAACGQLESVWPVQGSVVVRDGAIFCTAGRSSYLDGGIDLCRIEPGSGKILSTTPIYSPDPQTGRQPPHSAPAFMPGAREDILSADGSHVYLRDMVFDPQGRAQPEGNAHLFTLTGFLDDSWAHRSYWIFGKHPSLATGCSSRDKNLVYGRLLVFNDSTIYGYGRAGVHWSNQLQDGPYRLYALDRNQGEMKWENRLPVLVRAMVLADKTLFLAGQPATETAAPWAQDEERSGVLVAVSASDGSVLAEYPLDSPPVFDGMAVTGGRLYLSLDSGRMVCMEERR